ncbi:MAG: hypothetical protein GF399_07910 [Candidatus Coatesbacteria bacterium]|nr:hypothetical protein [Candidatus Coatesbacteria bacterium]
MSAGQRRLIVILVLSALTPSAAATYLATYESLPGAALGDYLELTVLVGERLAAHGGSLNEQSISDLQLEYSGGDLCDAGLALGTLELELDWPAAEADLALLLSTGPARLVPVIDPAGVLWDFETPAGVELGFDGYRVVVHGGGRGDVAPGADTAWALRPDTDGRDYFYLLDEAAALTLAGLSVEVGENDFGHPELRMTFDEAGTANLAELTAANHAKPLAVVSGDLVITAPVVREPIGDGRVVLTGLEESLLESLAAVFEQPLPDTLRLLNLRRSD